MIATLTTIWFLHLAALLTPGANFLVVSQLAASDRARSAGFATLGVGLGTLLWAGAAHGLGAALREAAGTGLRHEARPADNPAYYVAGFAGGATMAAALSADWAASLGRVRWGGYVVLGGLVGSALPDILLRVGPAVRTKVESLR